MNNLLKWSVDHIAEIISIIALFTSALTANHQRNLDKRIALLDKRLSIIKNLDKDILPTDLEVDLFFPKCREWFELLVKAKQKINNAKFDLNEYFTYVSIYQKVPVDIVKQEFMEAEMLAEENEDDSFKDYCNERVIIYQSIGEDESKTGDYIELNTKLQNVKKKYTEYKLILLKKLKRFI